MVKLKTVSRLLEIKDRRKEELAREIRKLKDLIDHERSGLHRLEKSFMVTIEKLRERQKGQLTNAGEMGLLYDYMDKLVKKMKEKKTIINKRLQELEDQQHVLSEVYKEKKLFELWKGKMVKEMAREKSLSEQKEMDDLSLSKWIRK